MAKKNMSAYEARETLRALGSIALKLAELHYEAQRVYPALAHDIMAAMQAAALATREIEDEIRNSEERSDQRGVDTKGAHGIYR